MSIRFNAVMSHVCTVSSSEAWCALLFAGFDSYPCGFESAGRIAVRSVLFAAPILDAGSKTHLVHTMLISV